MNKKLQDLQYEYLNRAKPTKQKQGDKKAAAHEKLAKEIASLQEQCTNLSKSKVDVAAHSYDLVSIVNNFERKIDKSIENLDEELRKFEEDIKQQSDQLNSLRGNTRKSKISKPNVFKLC